MLDSSSGAHKSSLGGTQTCCKVILGPSNPVHENWYDIYVKDKKWKVEAEGTGLKTYIDSIRRQNAFSKNSESYQIIGSGEPVEVKLRNLIDLYHRQPYSIQVRDPVGAHSLHVCTLHGEFELAWAWICEMKNILPPQHWYEWVTAEYRPEFPGVPDTPYQGETILHIAIVHRNRDFVSKLLLSQALLEKEDEGFERAWAKDGEEKEDRNADEFLVWHACAVVKLLATPATGKFFERGAPCYYGGLPINFATAVGIPDLVVEISTITDKIQGHFGALNDFMKRTTPDIGDTHSFRSTATGGSVATEFAGLRLMPLHLVCDQHGNTPLHLCAIWDLEHMYDCLVDLLSETRSSKFVRMWQCVANNDGHSPLLLAAFMGQKVILSHLLEKKTVMCWEYGTVKCMALNVDGIDEPHGALSALTHRSKKALSETFIRHAGAKKTMAADDSVKMKKMMQTANAPTPRAGDVPSAMTKVSRSESDGFEWQPPENRRKTLGRTASELNPTPLDREEEDLKIDSQSKISVLSLLCANNHYELASLEQIEALVEIKWKVYGIYFLKSAVFVCLGQVLLFFIATLFPIRWNVELRAYESIDRDVSSGNVLFKLGVDIVILFDMMNTAWNWWARAQKNYVTAHSLGPVGSVWRHLASTPGARGVDAHAKFFLVIFYALQLAMRITQAASSSGSIKTLALQYQVNFLAIASICSWFRLLLFFMAYENIGVYIVVVMEIWKKDIKQFLVVALLTIVAFSNALVLMKDRAEDMLNEATARQSFVAFMKECFKSFFISIGGVIESEGVFVSDEFDDGHRVMWLCLYLILGSIILILFMNILIAQMNQTWSNLIAFSEMSWRLERANLMIEFEQRLSQKARQELREQYIDSETGKPEFYYEIMKVNKVDAASLTGAQVDGREDVSKADKHLVSENPWFSLPSWANTAAPARLFRTSSSYLEN